VPPCAAPLFLVSYFQETSAAAYAAQRGSMFGYVVPLKNELKVKELMQYQAYYCGLCTSIGSHFGETAKLTLNYDSAFAALLLTALGGKEPATCTPKRCMYKPLQKKRPVAQDSEAMRFAADLNVALAWYKLWDDWQDEKKITAFVGKNALKSAAKRISADRPNMMAAIEKGISELSLLEKEKCDVLDAPADCFARLMRESVREAPLSNERLRPALLSLFYHIGRWIYLIDAWEDRAQDGGQHTYNVFNISGAGKDRASFLMHCSINEAIQAYELLDVAINREILDNILYLGCASKTQHALGGKHEQSL